MSEGARASGQQVQLASRLVSSRASRRVHHCTSLACHVMLLRITSSTHRQPIHTEPVISTPLAGIPVCSYVGGLRRLTAAEREEWRRHGAPRPPAPGQLAALEAAAAAEEDWSSDEEELIEDLELGRSKAGQPGKDWQRWWEARIWQLLRAASRTIPCCTQQHWPPVFTSLPMQTDADLAAELEAELEADLIPPAAAAAAAAGPAGGPAAPVAAGVAGALGAVVVAPGAVDAAAAEAAAAAEEAAPGPAAPPGQPIAMQLGQAAGGAGQPVALANGGSMPPGPAAAGDVA